MLSSPEIKAEVKNIFQTVEDFAHRLSQTLGDWYFTGDYPTPGVESLTEFHEFYEGKDATY
jgi:amidophosphoribosyltransferase